MFGLPFRNPIGLAAGYDKQAQAMPALLAAGFGFVEVGTVTPLPQPGNPRPRLFRLPEDGAVINRFGFNSVGAAVAAARLSTRRTSTAAAATAAAANAADTAASVPAGVVGVNIGKNKNGEAVTDYVDAITALAPFADYLVVNVSSPNTPGLRGLQGRTQLLELLTAVHAARRALPWGDPRAAALHAPPPRLEGDDATLAAWRSALAARGTPPPLLVKVAPDLSPADVEDIAAVVNESHTVDGLIATNTTVARPPTLRGAAAGEVGGLSGRPLTERSTAVIRSLYAATGGAVPIIGVGGVSCGADAYAKIRAGASLVQLYSALAYAGPGVIADIKADLAARLRADGYAHVSEAVGADHHKQ